METNGKYMVKIKILNNNSNNEATVNQTAINPFFQQTSSEKNNKPCQHLTCRFAAGKKTDVNRILIVRGVALCSEYTKDNSLGYRQMIP